VTNNLVKVKKSGIEWIDTIPVHWDVLPLFAVFRERQAPNIGNKEANLLSLSYGKIIRKNIATNFWLLPESFDTYNIVEPGDLVLRLTDLQNDKRSLRCGLVYERGIVTSAYLSLEILEPKRLNPAYAYYLLHSYDLKKVFYSMGGGVRQSIKFDDLKRLPIILPPLKEQLEIASLLDSQTADIDSQIKRNEKEIDLLKEYRNSRVFEIASGKASIQMRESNAS